MPFVGGTAAFARATAAFARATAGSHTAAPDTVLDGVDRPEVAAHRVPGAR
ncbi:hypothetical protein [Streptomyces caelestis]|uniref:hypothetical protein n=1 Tax=Streptomyces caelestis TaxID=36816 RepID=UPI00364FAA84